VPHERLDVCLRQHQIPVHGINSTADPDTGWLKLGINTSLDMMP